MLVSASLVFNIVKVNHFNVLDVLLPLKLIVRLLVHAFELGLFELAIAHRLSHLDLAWTLLKL